MRKNLILAFLLIISLLFFGHAVSIYSQDPPSSHSDYCNWDSTPSCYSADEDPNVSTVARALVISDQSLADQFGYYGVCYTQEGVNYSYCGYNQQTGTLYSTGGAILNTGGADYGLIVAQGNVGIGIDTPYYTLDVEGTIHATGGIISRGGIMTGDINFNKDGEKLWRMFEDEEGLYLESVKTKKVYKFNLKEVQ